jgi:hypothetical protein
MITDMDDRPQVNAL